MVKKPKPQESAGISTAPTEAKPRRKAPTT